MANPQQPELARSRRTPALDPDATEAVLTGQDLPAVDGPRGPIPVDNLPGHHPEHEQDKPDGDAFLAKMHQLAEEAKAEPEPEAETDAVDLRDRPDSPRAERVAAAVTAPLRETAKVLEKLRDKL